MFDVPREAHGIHTWQCRVLQDNHRPPHYYGTVRIFYARTNCSIKNHNCNTFVFDEWFAFLCGLRDGWLLWTHDKDKEKKLDERTIYLLKWRRSFSFIEPKRGSMTIYKCKTRTSSHRRDASRWHYFTLEVFGKFFVENDFLKILYFALLILVSPSE